VRLPKLTAHRKAMLALVFFGPGLAAWIPYLTGGQSRLWLSILLHSAGFLLPGLAYFFFWRSDDKLLGFVEAVRKQPTWNVWLTVDGKRGLLGVVRGTEEEAARFGKQELMKICWNSELGIVAGQVEVEPKDLRQ
jgi:hypothetical protein